MKEFLMSRAETGKSKRSSSLFVAVPRAIAAIANRRSNWPAVGMLLVMMVLSTAASARAQTNVNIDRLVPDLEPEIQRTMMEGKIPSITVALISGDRVIWTGAYGYANLWARTPAVPSSVYLIGSTFKAMSTIALLEQMEQGKFKLDDKVSDYLSEFK